MTTVKLSVKNIDAGYDYSPVVNIDPGSTGLTMVSGQIAIYHPLTPNTHPVRITAPVTLGTAISANQFEPTIPATETVKLLSNQNNFNSALIASSVISVVAGVMSDGSKKTFISGALTVGQALLADVV